MSSQSASDTPASLGVATAEEWEELTFIEQAAYSRAAQRIDQSTMSDPPSWDIEPWYERDGIELFWPSLDWSYS
jgi:hypothetical protein